MFSCYSSDTTNKSCDNLHSTVDYFQNVLENKKNYIKINESGEYASVSVTANKQKAANIQQITNYIYNLLDASDNLSFNDLTVLNHFYQKKTQRKSIFFRKQRKEIKKNQKEIKITKAALNYCLTTRNQCINDAMKFLTFMPTIDEDSRRRLLENFNFDTLRNTHTLISKVQIFDRDLLNNSLSLINSLDRSNILSSQANIERRVSFASSEIELRSEKIEECLEMLKSVAFSKTEPEKSS
jgi:hypothetical protein